jgi:IS30 family transposase
MGRGSGRAFRLSSSDRLELQRLVRMGRGYAESASAVGCSAKSVQRLLIKTGGLKPRNLPRSALRLSASEREEISRGLTSGSSCQAIAVRLNRSTSTVSRDVSANGGRLRYRAWRADALAERMAHRPKRAKLAASTRLRCEVERGLARRWSPQQITARLRMDFPDDVEMRVSHETIYQSLFVQGRGALRKELTQSLTPDEPSVAPEVG